MRSQLFKIMSHVFEVELVKAGQILSLHGWTKQQVQDAIQPHVKCDIACWNCCHKFDTAPVRLPFNRALIEGLHFFHSSGCFCSWNCAKAYQLSNFKGRVNYNLALLANRVRVLPDGEKSNESNAHVLKAAPTRNKLKLFGGNLTIEQFRDGFMTLFGEILGTDAKVCEKGRAEFRAGITPFVFLNESLLKQARYSCTGSWLLNVDNNDFSHRNKRQRNNTIQFPARESIQSIHEKMIQNQKSREHTKMKDTSSKSKMSKLIRKK